MTNITKEGYEQMQEKVRQKALKKKYSNHQSIGGFSNVGRPCLTKEQLKLAIKKQMIYSSDGKVRIYIKPLSVNSAWQGKRFKTPAYIKYTKELTALLPNIIIPPSPYKVHYRFGFSSSLSDWDNTCKPMQDIISKKYQFNDKLIKRAIIDIEMVEKGYEFLEFKIESL